MHTPTVSELLSAWEKGLSLPNHERALLLLQVAYPDSNTDALALLSIGRRDSRLLKLRETLFGSQICSQASCPHCREQLELNFDVTNILLEDPELNESQFAVKVDGYHVEFRLPNSNDLGAVMAAANAAERHSGMLARCISSAVGHDSDSNATVSNADELPQAIAERVEERMAEMDPQANVEIDLSCPDCRGNWTAPFDITSFLWSEVNVWAKRILHEVHLLASCYGWSEREILGMHSVKRQIYLQMAYA